MKRHQCEFKNCECKTFMNMFKKSKICWKCKHANIWHSRKSNENKEAPPSDSYLQFISSRKKARAPKYVSDKRFPVIFTPKELPVAVATLVLNPVFCEAFHLLDV